MQEAPRRPEVIEHRPRGSRTTRSPRPSPRGRPARINSEGDCDDLSAQHHLMDAHPTEASALDTGSAPTRDTLCLPDLSNDTVLHGGEAGFADLLRKHFPLAESHASERLIALKRALRKASTYDFWSILTKELCAITGAQCSFVAKRIIEDDQNAAVEMPALGEPGSCLTGVAFYLDNDSDVQELFRDYRYHTYGSPCAWMRYEKVFIIPDKMSVFLPNIPTPLPWQQSEAFMGIPLFLDDKCFAHFGLIWSLEGMQKKQLSWTFLEMFMHSLEDQITQRLGEGRGFAKEPEATTSTIIPLTTITASQCMKPYARNLSHELRTPMQGIIGMIDIIHSTVLDAIEDRSNGSQAIFEEIKSHIEVVQESSRRAIEAADNVIHAYDLDMQMPETPLTPGDTEGQPFVNAFRKISSEQRPERTLQDQRGLKRGRPTDLEIDSYLASKRVSTSPEIESEPMSRKSARSSDDKNSTRTPYQTRPAHHLLIAFLRARVSEALKSVHPISASHVTTPSGEHVQFSTQGLRDEGISVRNIYLHVEADVPEILITEEHELQYPLQKIIDNAVKFTDAGSITLSVKLGNIPQMVEIRVVDTGCGISRESQLHVFEPHFQEDASISRVRDGLGLSLFNSKAHVRKFLKGDITLERSATEGPSKGSEFLLRLPLAALDSLHTSRPALRLNSISSKNIPSPPMSANSIGPPKAVKKVAHNSALAAAYPLNFLVAEDNPINRTYALAALDKLGYSRDCITLAFDGAEAVEQYQSSLSKPIAERFQLILMDIWMPRMNGYAATVEIAALAKKHGEQPPIVVAVTADITKACMDTARETGMQGFISKPYKVVDVERLIMQQQMMACKGMGL